MVWRKTELAVMKRGGEESGMTRMLGGAILIFGFWLLSTMVIF